MLNNVSLFQSGSFLSKLFLKQAWNILDTHALLLLLLFATSACLSFTLCPFYHKVGTGVSFVFQFFLGFPEQ
jgi:hypothetical protein